MTDYVDPATLTLTLAIFTAILAAKFASALVGMAYRWAVTKCVLSVWAWRLKRNPELLLKLTPAERAYLTKALGKAAD